MRRFYFASLFLVLTFGLKAQALFLEDVYDNVKVTTNQVYGINATILAFPVVGQAIPQPLIMDVYEPQGDTAAVRPLIIFWHTGNFLPFPQNGNIGGTLRDSAVVEMCRRAARAGYVVASADYRTGWNPVAVSKDERVLTLINAAYRGVQDANTCVRFWKKSVTELGNPFRIDSSRIVHMGDGTGGYVGLNVGALDSYIKIPTASNGKFLLSDGMGNFFPMIIEGVNGDVFQTGYAKSGPRECRTGEILWPANRRRNLMIVGIQRPCVGVTIMRFSSACSLWVCLGFSGSLIAEKPTVIELWPGKAPDEVGGIGEEKVVMSLL